MPSGNRREVITSLTLALLGSYLSLWMVIDRGWVPFDEGTIGQAAERVLLGQLPHLDFAEPYTGGLAYYHALAMRLFGVTLLAPRFALFAAFCAWIPAVWWLAKHTGGNRWAAGVPIIATWWSVSIYPAAMPTWYLLFIGTWIVVALERWRTVRRTCWLALAGLLCGVAVTIKQTGLFLLAGTLLAVLFGEQEDTRQRWVAGEPTGRTDVVIVVLLATLLALVLTLLRGRLDSGELFHLLLPIGGLISLAMYREWQLTDDGLVRWRALGRMTGLILAAAAVPLVIFIVPYLQRGALDPLLDGTIGQSVRRITELRRSMPSAETLVRTGWLAYLLVLVEGVSPRRRWLRILALLGGLLLLAASFRTVAGYRRLWFFGTALLPLAVTAVAAAGVRAWRTGRTLDPVVLALASITALQALNQFPYSAPNYYGYVAPLAILTAGAAAAHFGALARASTAWVMLAGFGLLLRVGSVHNVGAFPAWWDYSHRLAVPRGGLYVSSLDSARYSRLLDLVARHRGTGGVYAGPELPEVYFLAGTLSPGRDAYSLFAAPVSDSSQLAAVFAGTDARVMVIKARPMFLPPLGRDVYHWLADRFPQSASLDSLEVRWRTDR